MDLFCFKQENYRFYKVKRVNDVINSQDKRGTMYIRI